MTSSTEARRSLALRAARHLEGQAGVCRASSWRGRCAARWSLRSTRKARAISSVVSPPIRRSVSATRASGRQHRMAGGEDQAQQLVADVVVERRLDVLDAGVASRRGRGRSRRACASCILLRRNPSMARRLAAAISQAPGLCGMPVLRPFGERGDERVLRQLLGQADVAHHAGEAGDEPGLLDPEDGLDRLMGFGRRHASRLSGTRGARVKPGRHGADSSRLRRLLPRPRSCSSGDLRRRAARRSRPSRRPGGFRSRWGRASDSGSASPTRPPRPCP